MKKQTKIPGILSVVIGLVLLIILLTLAEVLKERGFDTLMDVENGIAVGSNNLQGFSKFRKKNKMKKKEIALVENTMKIAIADIDHKRSPGFPDNCHRLYGLLHYLLTVPADQNFFLLKWFLDPHAPYNPPERFKKEIPLDAAKLPQDERFYWESRVRVFRKLSAKKNFSDYELSYIKELYKAEVEALDQRVGFIIKALKHRGLLKKTLIVFTADRGELFGEHGRFGHGHSYHETLIRIPPHHLRAGHTQRKKEKNRSFSPRFNAHIERPAGNKIRG